MAKLFISYSHKDRDFIEKILKQIEHEKHDIKIDEKFLSISDTITTDIQKNMAESDFVIVFLSSNSVTSKWVRQEIYETLYLELKNKHSKLIPCIIDDCQLPEAFTKLKTFNRIYIDLKHDKEEAIKKLLNKINQGNKLIFENENYFILHLAVPDLDIYMTGERWGWEKHSELKYFEMLNKYLLFGFEKEKWEYFKHFVVCEEADAQRIRSQLQNSGYLVTGIGSKDFDTNKRRVWFCVKDYPIEGSSQDNRWT